VFFLRYLLVFTLIPCPVFAQECPPSPFRCTGDCPPDAEACSPAPGTVEPVTPEPDFPPFPFDERPPLIIVSESGAFVVEFNSDRPDFRRIDLNLELRNGIEFTYSGNLDGEKLYKVPRFIFSDPEIYNSDIGEIFVTGDIISGWR